MSPGSSFLERINGATTQPYIICLWCKCIYSVITVKSTYVFILASVDNGVGKVKRAKDGKPTRVRTVLSEKQLHTLRTCYGANPRPDALMKEQLVEMTGLSPRVIRVWFQNKRCKDKKKSMLLKHMQQQEKVRCLYKLFVGTCILPY